MKKLIQNVKNGKTELIDIPIPKPLYGKVLIRTTRSLISLGTEKMLVNFAKSNFISKAKQQPEKVRMVLEKIQKDGLAPTIKAVKSKLDQPMSLGYCNVGVVEQVGEGVKSFKTGDRVISNGSHSEFVSISENLVHKIPDNVSDDDASFTVIGSIALQSVRLMNPTIGETIVVYGLGLIGLLTVQILKSNGCNVIGIDLDQSKVNIAKSFGVDAINPNEGDEVGYVINQTENIGCDGVIITASASTDKIISNSAKMSRKRGRIILVGVIGLNISRDDFYEKELTFQVSCSYGPGRYDYDYEEKGNDYPISFVRWTENRNFGTILNLIGSKKIIVNPLVSKLVNFEDAISIYDSLNKTKSIATIFKYSEKPIAENKVKIKVFDKKFNNENKIIGLIGSGGFTSSTILPSLKKNNYQIKYISSSNGLNSTLLAKKYDIKYSTTENSLIFNDHDVNLIFITTRHNTHAELVLKGLKHNKDIFVEKPLCLNKKELKNIEKEYRISNSKLTIGYNRRFAPFSKTIKEALKFENSEMNIVVNVNAGYIEKSSWIQDMKIGGGRIIGEACHFIDLCIFYSDSLVSSVIMNSLGIHKEDNTDNVSILLKHKNGSNSCINYFSNGSNKYSKERIEIYVNGKNIILDNWRELKFYGFKGYGKYNKSQDKGHNNQFLELKNNFLDKEKQLIDIEELLNSTNAAFACLESNDINAWVKVS